MIRPRANPIEMARTTSFFMSRVENILEVWYCQVAVDITFNKGVFKIKGKTGVVAVGEKIVINDNFTIDGPGEYEVGGVSVIGLVG